MEGAQGAFAEIAGDLQGAGKVALVGGSLQGEVGEVAWAVDPLAFRVGEDSQTEISVRDESVVRIKWKRDWSCILELYTDSTAAYHISYCNFDARSIRSNAGMSW